MAQLIQSGRKNQGLSEMPLSKDLLYLIRQFCDEEKLQKTAHMLEQETGFFFDMNYFDELVMSGNWNEAENYLSGFTDVQANQHSTKTYFEIRKHKLYESLDKHDVAMSLDILLKDLKVFASSNKQLYGEMTSLLTLDDFREHPSLSSLYGDVIPARRQMMDAIKLIIKANPDFRSKLEFPQIDKSRLRRLINQSLNWQHIQCAYPHSEPQIKTLFSDHKCSGESNQQNPSPFEAMSKSGKLNACPPEFTASLNLGNQNNQATTLESAKDFDNVSRIRSRISLDKMVAHKHVPTRSHNLNFTIPNDFPKTVECCMDMSSSPTSMDFHPAKDTLLILVGNIMGDVELWDITSQVKLFSSPFMIWKRETISVLLSNDRDIGPRISVNRVLWSPDGSIFGVAFSKRVVQWYSYHVNTNYTKKQQEIDAHLGGVNDLAFSSPSDRLLVITCGEDKFIKVWDSTDGSNQYTFEGHGAPVYSLCPHVKEDIHFLLSTSTNGEIKAWSFENTGPTVEYDAPGGSCMRMAYSGDGKRLFSCGTNEDGDSYILEWNQTEGYITRTYHGLSRTAAGVVQFSTTRNRFLVAGDDHLIKVWNMDNVQILTVLDADGDLPETPYVCFNKGGTLLAAFANDNMIKILANDVCHQLLQSSKFPSFDSIGCLSDSLQKISIGQTSNSARVRVDDEESIPMEEHMKPQVPLKLNNVPNNQKCSKIVQVSSCQSLMLPSEIKTNKVCRLAYTNAGNGILGLAADGIHLLWKWSGHKCNNSGKATINHAPQLWQPKSGLLMINDLINDDESFKLASPCFALSKNDTYLVSASGKKVSLFNTVTFKELKSCLLPPPAATCIAFYPPDNNMVAIGMDDSTILVYNMRLGEDKKWLIGHLTRITGLAFSNTFKVLVSSGVDAQIIVWDSTTWEKKMKSASLQVPAGWLPSETSETNVQFHQDQKHFLAIHETQLAIYETTNLKRVNQWMIGNFCARITNATFSSDNHLVYAVMKGGIVVILTALDLCPRFEIDPSIYLPTTLSSSSSDEVYPIVVAAHPQNPNQFALGLSDGGVVVLEPPESQGTWMKMMDHTPPPDDKEFAFASTIIID